MISESLLVDPKLPRTPLKSWKSLKKKLLFTKSRCDIDRQALVTYISVYCFSFSTLLIFAIKAFVHMMNR